MKNLHVLPTNKPSRLQRCASSEWFDISKESLIDDRWKYQNIYITNNEKLPYDSTIFHTGAFYHRDFGGDIHIINKDTHYPNPNFCKRIILTTDESLFKYGVQPIDDEFLEWFVKNPSCESVEVNKEWNEERIIDNKDIGDYSYKIIIPTEEPKQETLEEAAEKLSKNAYKKHSVKDDKLSLDEQIQRSGGFIVGFKEGMIEGAKHQSDSPTITNEWFEQFKKK